MSDRDPGPPAGIAAPADATDGAGAVTERQVLPPSSAGAFDGRQAPGAGGGERKPLPPSFPWLALAATALIALGLLWLAAEQHYQGCLQAVEARTGSTSLDRLVRQEQVDACSRLPI